MGRPIVLLPRSGLSHEERRRLKAEIKELDDDVRAFAKVDDGKPIPTLFSRCAALHAKMDQVLEETSGRQNYLPPKPKEKSNYLADYRPQH